MLKFTYTETGLHLEHLIQSLETWIISRAVLAVRTGQSLQVEHCTASFLLPLTLVERYALDETIHHEEKTLSLSRCDTDQVEITLRGTWVTTHAHSEEGVFVAIASYATESLLLHLWQESQALASSSVQR